MSKDLLDKLIAKRTAQDPAFPALVRAAQKRLTKKKSAAKKSTPKKATVVSKALSKKASPKPGTFAWSSKPIRAGVLRKSATRARKVF
jgi:hypothetical protein